MTPDLSPTISLVEGVMMDFDVNPAACRNDEGQYTIPTKFGELWVDIWYVPTEERSYFQIMSPIGIMPEFQQADLMRRVLELNYQFIEVAIVMFKEGLYFKTIREVDYLSKETIQLSINRVAMYADKYAEKLKIEHGLKPIVVKDDSGAAQAMPSLSADENPNP